jgi:hypothetical protein
MAQEMISTMETTFWVQVMVGDDKINSGQGDDQLMGGSGSDKFRCGSGNDTVTDFNEAEGDKVSGKCDICVIHTKIFFFNLQLRAYRGKNVGSSYFDYTAPNICNTPPFTFMDEWWDHPFSSKAHSHGCFKNISLLKKM